MENNKFQEVTECYLIPWNRRRMEEPGLVTGVVMATRKPHPSINEFSGKVEPTKETPQPHLRVKYPDGSEKLIHWTDWSKFDLVTEEMANRGVTRG